MNLTEREIEILNGVVQAKGDCTWGSIVCVECPLSMRNTNLCDSEKEFNLITAKRTLQEFKVLKILSIL